MKDKISGLSRRDIIKLGGAAAIFLLTSCSERKPFDDISIPKDSEPLSIYPSLEADYTEEDIQKLATLTTSEYNDTLGTSIDPIHVAASVKLIKDAEIYREIVKKANRSEISQDATLPSSLTADGNIYLFEPALRKATNSLTKDDQRADLVIQLLYHELAHFDATSYPSSEVETIVKEKLSGNFSGELTINEIEIKGARFNLTVDTKDPEWKEFSIFTNVDEVEAEILSDYVTQNRKREALVEPGGYKNLLNRKQMYLRLLERVFQTDRTVNPFKIIVSIRAQKGGREKWLTFIGEKLGYTEENQMTAGFTALQFIDQENIQGFNQLMQQ